jgi:hypothetical protein
MQSFPKSSAGIVTRYFPNGAVGAVCLILYRTSEIQEELFLLPLFYSVADRE